MVGISQPRVAGVHKSPDRRLRSLTPGTAGSLRGAAWLVESFGIGNFPRVR